jgi:hypothetical protein
MEMIKNSFSEFEGDNGSECSSGKVANQALSTCLAESNFEGCAAQQTAAFPGSGIARRPSLRNPLDPPSLRRRLIRWSVRLGGTKKSATTFFKPGKYYNCTLNSEINARWCCCLGEMGAETREMAVTRGLCSVQS